MNRWRVKKQIPSGLNRTTRREFLERLGAAAALWPVLGEAAIGGPEAQKANEVLEAIRAQADLPALAGLCLKDGQVVARGAVGVRKYGDA